MLHKVTIENFFSIASKQELKFDVSDNAPDLACFKKSLTDDSIRSSAVIGIFGPNAAGKSTVLRSIVSSVLFALRSFDWTDQIKFFFQPYRTNEWMCKPTKIMIDFDSQLNNLASPKIFRYELNISHKDFFNKTVLYEALSYAPKGKMRRLFERKEQDINFAQDFGLSSNDPRKKSIRPNASVMSTLTKFNHPISIHLSNLINTLQTNTIGFTQIESPMQQVLTIYANDKECFDSLNKELRRFDIGLESMQIEQSPQGLFAKFKHIGLDDFIFLEEESKGTQRFIEIFPRLHYALKVGGVALIDELDTAFHPLILPELFRWFYDPIRNLNKAQLIFTAHNPSVLNELVKEQVFFVEKQAGKSTCIYGASDIKGLRREPSLMKKYLSGELGAVPHIG